MKIITEINIEDPAWKNKEIFQEGIKILINKIIKKTLDYLKFDCQEIIISILLTDNQRLQTLNKDHLGKNYPTNILSFPYLDEEELDNCKEEEIYLGDLAISFDKLKSEADEMKISIHNHLTHLLIHGLLHLFGYDHEESEEKAIIMEDLEIEILKIFGIENPYWFD